MKKIILLIFLLIPISINAKELVEFNKCVDGDTFKVKINNEVKTIRMLAIDTPETVHPTKEEEYYGKEASDYTCNALNNAKILEIEYDNNSDKTDKYDRLLAWVFVDDYLLQDNLVRNGYAEVAYLYGDYKYTNILKDHEELAKVEKLGIWKDEKESPNRIVFLISLLIMSFLAEIFRNSKKKLKKKIKKSKINLDF